MSTHTDPSQGREALLTVEELAFLSGTNVQVIKRITRLELIKPDPQDQALVFSPQALPRVHRLLRLHRQLEIGWTAMPLVLDLLDRIEALEDELARLRRRP